MAAEDVDEALADASHAESERTRPAARECTGSPAEGPAGVQILSSKGGKRLRILRGRRVGVSLRLSQCSRGARVKGTDAGLLSGVRLRAFARFASYGDASARPSMARTPAAATARQPSHLWGVRVRLGWRKAYGVRVPVGGPPSFGPPGPSQTPARTSARQPSPVGTSLRCLGFACLAEARRRVRGGRVRIPVGGPPSPGLRCLRCLLLGLRRDSLRTCGVFA